MRGSQAAASGTKRMRAEDLEQIQLEGGGELWCRHAREQDDDDQLLILSMARPSPFPSSSSPGKPSSSSSPRRPLAALLAASRLIRCSSAAPSTRRRPLPVQTIAMCRPGKGSASRRSASSRSCRRSSSITHFVLLRPTSSCLTIAQSSCLCLSRSSGRSEGACLRRSGSCFFRMSRWRDGDRAALRGLWLGLRRRQRGSAYPSLIVPTRVPPPLANPCPFLPSTQAGLSAQCRAASKRFPSRHQGRWASGSRVADRRRLKAGESL